MQFISEGESTAIDSVNADARSNVEFRIEHSTEVTRVVLEETFLTTDQSETDEATATPVTVANRHLKSRTWPVWFLFTLALAGSGVWGGWQWFHREVPGDHHEVVLGEFTNATGDSSFDGPLNIALAIDLKESPYLLIAGSGKVRDTLKLMEHSPDEHLIPAVAREVCQRINDQAVLSGSITRFDQKYLVTLTALDCATGNELIQSKAVASDRDGVLQAVDSTSAQMRRRLGEPLKSLRHFNAPLNEKMTNSLPALKFYSQADALVNQAKYVDAAPLLLQAIAQDPTFAAAYSELALAYNRLGEYQLSEDNVRKAYEMRDHASELDRFAIVNQYRTLDGDADAIIKNNQDWTNIYPSDVRPWLILSNEQTFIGHPELAMEPARRALSLDPKNAIAYEFLTRAQIHSGHLDQAKASIRQATALHLDGASMHTLILEVADLEHNQAAIDAEIARVKGTAMEPSVMVWVAGLDCAHGKARAEVAAMNQLVEGYRRQGLNERADDMLAMLPRQLAELSLTGEARSMIRRITPKDNMTDFMVALAYTGQIDRAADDLKIQLQNHPHDTIWLDVRATQIKAAIDIHRDKPKDAIADLEPDRPFDGRSFELIAMRGIAYLNARRPELAEGQFREIIDHPYVNPITANLPLAHLGLARAYAAEGKDDLSRREYETFLLIWKDADADLPVLRQARAELARLKKK